MTQEIRPAKPKTNARPVGTAMIVKIGYATVEAMLLMEGNNAKENGFYDLA